MKPRLVSSEALMFVDKIGSVSPRSRFVLHADGHAAERVAAVD